MESFIYTDVTADGCPIAVCGFCIDGGVKSCTEAFSKLKHVEFGYYKSGFTIDYRLGTIINECAKEIIGDIFLLGATVHTKDADCSTGGIFGVPDGEYLSSDETVINDTSFVVGFKPGYGAFGAFINNVNDRRKITNIFEDGFNNDNSVNMLYGALLDVSERFILITDGCGEGASGIVANESDFVTLKQVKKRFLEQKDYFGLKKIGVLGGTFDPIHNGHLIAAQTVYDKLKLDKVIFIPTGNTTYKESENISTGETRYTMTSLAIEKNDRFCVSSIEIDKVGVSYTEDTINELRRHCDSDAEIYFILGADVMQAVIGWKGFNRLIKLCKFVVVTRPGYSYNVVGNKETLEYLKRKNVEIQFLEVPAIDISSSYIRTAVGEGKSIKYLLPDEVEKYIVLHRLYKGRKIYNRKEEADIDRILKLIN